MSDTTTILALECHQLQQRIAEMETLILHDRLERDCLRVGRNKLAGEVFKLRSTGLELQAEVQRLRAELAEANIERDEAGVARDFLNLSYDRLRAELKAATLKYCYKCNNPLSQCGRPDSDGEPTLDCMVCQLRTELAMATDGCQKGEAARLQAGGMEMEIQQLRTELDAARERIAELEDYKQKLDAATKLSQELAAIQPKEGEL